MLQGLSQVSQTQVTQPITIHRQVKTVPTAPAAQVQKHILVRKSNASGAQIMPLGTSQESQVQTQAGGKSGIAYLKRIIKPQETVVIPAGNNLCKDLIVQFKSFNIKYRALAVVFHIDNCFNGKFSLQSWDDQCSTD